MKKGLTLVELILIIVAVTIVVLSLPMIINPPYVQINHNETKCRANLDQMGKILKVYLLDFGRNVHYPKAQGEEFLVTLYHKGLLAEPIVFLCPSTRDTNDDGADLAFVKGFGDSQGPCSYAGRKNIDEKIYPGLFQGVYEHGAITTIAADDWEDGEDENHQDGAYVNFLFLDGHFEGIKSPQVDFAKDYASLYDPITN